MISFEETVDVVIKILARAQAAEQRVKELEVELASLRRTLNDSNK